jgi:hypothetical protein
VNGFFEPPPSQRVKFEMLPPEEWMGPSRAMLPAVVPIERIVSAKKAAVYVDNLWAYPTGFELDVFAVAKEGEALADPIDFEYRSRQEAEIPPEKLRIGFEFADGSSVTNIRSFEDLPPKSPRMSSTRGSYGEEGWEQSYWVWPLPPAGPLTLVCEWPAVEIPLTRVELDSQAITEAAARAQEPFSAS